MAEFGMYLAAIFTGVFGVAIGFIIIGAAALILALPYLMMNRRKHMAPPTNARRAQYE